jgi:hypothetical protein
MGLNFRFSKSSYDPNTNVGKGNPNPNRYSIIESIERNNFLLIKINYIDCSNYEGNKILLYKGVDLTSLLSQGSIDPHFSENKIIILQLQDLNQLIKVGIWHYQLLKDNKHGMF